MAREMRSGYHKLFDPRQALQLGRDGSNPAEVCQRFWRPSIVFEALLTRLADADRTQSSGGLYDSERVDHDVLVVDFFDP